MTDDLEFMHAIMTGVEIPSNERNLT